MNWLETRGKRTCGTAKSSLAVGSPLAGSNLTTRSTELLWFFSRRRYATYKDPFEEKSTCPSDCWNSAPFGCSTLPLRESSDHISAPETSASSRHVREEWEGLSMGAGPDFSLDRKV